MASKTTVTVEPVDHRLLVALLRYTASPAEAGDVAFSAALKAEGVPHQRSLQEAAQFLAERLLGVV